MDFSYLIGQVRIVVGINISYIKLSNARDS